MFLSKALYNEANYMLLIYGKQSANRRIPTCFSNLSSRGGFFGPEDARQHTRIGIPQYPTKRGEERDGTTTIQRPFLLHREKAEIEEASLLNIAQDPPVVSSGYTGDIQLSLR